ncbi:MAG: hypothetical protein IKA40_03135 [Clostridia bacterium]|nr:hypothetical protein [Clostridia bacterium]
MDEKTRAQDEISLSEIFKALLRKVKVLVLALLIGVIVGASFGVIKTVNVKYYGTKIDFYVNPKKDSTTVIENNSQYGVYGAYGLHVMDNMVTLLNSDLFAERLTLNKDGLPLNGEDTFEEVDGVIVLKTKAPSLVNDAALNALIEEARTAILEAKNAQKAVEEAEKAVDPMQEELTLATQELTKATSTKNIIQEDLTLAEARRAYLETKLTALWERAGGQGGFGVSELLPTGAMTEEAKAQYDGLYLEWTETTEECSRLNDELTAATKAINDPLTGKQALKDAAALAVQEAKKTLTTEKENSIEVLAKSQDATEKAVEKWREMPGYAAMVATNRECVSFSYYNEDERPEDLEDLARSFIYVKISVLNNQNLANDLYKKVLEIMPIFVEENMAIPSGYSGTKCRRITRDDGIVNTNQGYTLSTAVKYGLLAGAAALVLACVAVIVLDRSDKRLRNYEQTMSAFNVPVLGVIPTIEKEEEPKDDTMAEVKNETV